MASFRVSLNVSAWPGASATRSNPNLASNLKSDGGLGTAVTVFFDGESDSELSSAECIAPEWHGRTRTLSGNTNTSSYMRCPGPNPNERPPSPKCQLTGNVTQVPRPRPTEKQLASCVHIWACLAFTRTTASGAAANHRS